MAVRYRSCVLPLPGRAEIIDDTMIDDRRGKNSEVCIGVWVRVLMLGRRVEGTDSLASIITSQDT